MFLFLIYKVESQLQVSVGSSEDKSLRWLLVTLNQIFLRPNLAH